MQNRGNNGANKENVGSTSRLTDAQRFRQTRFTEHSEKMRLDVAGKAGLLKNWSRTGIGFELPEPSTAYKVGDVVDDVTIFCGKILLYRGSVTLRFIQTLGNGSKYYGASFTGSLFLIDGVNAAIKVQDFTTKLQTLTSEIETINPEVCQSLTAIRMSLRKLREFCNETERSWRDLSFDSRCESERVLVPFLSHKVTELFTYFNQKVARQVDIDALKEDSIYHRVFTEETSFELEPGDFPRRAFAKPRGYPGDYEMMNQLYRGGYEGVTLYGRVLNHYVANESAGNSVRFRKDYFLKHFSTFLKHPGDLSILSIACGPAVEIQELCLRSSKEDLERLKFTLFDLDREALEHAQTKIFELAMREQKPVNVEFINASVKTFLSSQVSVGGQFDLIYSAGLFDYLDNLTAGALVKHFFRMVSPGGKLILGNFTKANPTKAFCHLILNWNLIHKTEEEILGWAKGVSGADISLEYDPQKINAFLVLNKNGSD